MRQIMTISAKQAAGLAAVIAEAEKKASELLGHPILFHAASHRFIPDTNSSEFAMIMEIVAEKFGFTIAEIKGISRAKQLIKARHMLWLLSYELLEKSYQELAKLTNRNNHTSVLHGVNKMKDHIEREEDLREVYLELKNRIQNF